MNELKLFEVDGASLAYWDMGEGIPVIFLHAGMADSRMWESQMQAAVDAGYRAIAYDRRGFGKTQASDVEFSHVDDLEALMDGLDAYAALFVGASHGGALAIDFCLEAPERVAGLVLVGTSISGAPEPDFSPEILQFVDTMDAVFEAGDLIAMNAIEAHAWLDGPLSQSGRCQGPVRELFKTMNMDVLNKPFLSHEIIAEPAYDEMAFISTPILLVAGEYDFPHIVNRHEDLSEDMDNVFAVVIEGAAHMVSIEKPELFNSLMLEFCTAITGDDGDDDADESLDPDSE